MSVASIYQAAHGFNDHQVAELLKRAITPENASEYGIVAAHNNAELPAGAPSYWTVENGYLPGTLHPWTSPTTGETTWQIKPDTPVPDIEHPGKSKKYVFAKGWRPVLHPVRVVPGSDKVLIVEGTHQRIAAGIYAPDGWSVYGIAGCRGWSTEGLPIGDLLVCDGKDVTVVLDADMDTNLDVFNAGKALADELELSGATIVRFAKVSGGKKTGLDDILGARIESARADYVNRLIQPARCPEAAKIKQPSQRAIQAAKAAEREEKKRAAVEADNRRAASENRPMIDVSGDRHLVSGMLTTALKVRWDRKHLFSRGTPGEVFYRNGDVLTPLDRDALRDLIALCMRTGSQNKITGEWQDGWPDDGTLGVVLSRAREFSPIDTIASSPFVRRDGSICMTNGYDVASRAFVRMDPDLVSRLAVPDEPTEEDVRAAVKLLLDDWLVDMPFPTASDRAHALALILTPFVRLFMDVVPIAVLDGNGPSAGKGLLADLVSRLVLGRPAILKALPADNEEMRKAITSALLGGRPMMLWDEAHVLEGKALAQLLTVPTWSDRRLGVSADVEIDNRVTFAALGNNVRVEGDVGRRAYRIRIHPRMERPEDRDVNTFRHPDIRAWTDEHRAELLSAVLVLIRSWVVAGRPSGRADMGSFEQWSRTVGGILAHAGVPGFLDGRKEWLDGANTSTDTWASHLAWLRSTFKGRAFRTGEAATELSRAGMDAPLPAHTRALSTPEPTAAYAQSLGMVYHHRKDQTFYGLTLVRAANDNGSALWRVTSVEDAFEEDGGEDPSAGITLRHPGSGETDKSVKEGSVEVTEVREEVTTGTTGTTGTTSPEPTVRAREGLEAPKCVRGGAGLAPLPVVPVVPARVVAEVTAADPRNDLAPLIEALYAAHGDAGYESRCPECRQPEVLVDDLWYACPACSPGTVAANGRVTA